MQCCREMVERGVLPDLLLIGAKQNAQAIEQNESIRALQAAGMELRSDGGRGRANGSAGTGMMSAHRSATRLIFPLRTLPSCERWMRGCWRFFLPTMWSADVGCSGLEITFARHATMGGVGCG